VLVVIWIWIVLFVMMIMIVSMMFDDWRFWTVMMMMTHEDVSTTVTLFLTGALNRRYHSTTVVQNSDDYRKVYALS